MNITINGQEQTTRQGASILDVLMQLGITPDTVVVELNRSIIPGEAYAQTTLADGDHLEVLRFVGGG